jgi:hypothetical protein
MAKTSRSASKDVKSAMHRRKKGTLKRGKGGKGGTVKSKKQAIAIGLSEARKKGKKGKKVPQAQGGQEEIAAVALPYRSGTIRRRESLAPHESAKVSLEWPTL